MNRTRLAALWLVVGVLALAGCATSGGVNRHNAASANANLGANYLRKGDNGQARQSFRKALSYDKRNFNANWGMAIASQRLGDAAEARRYYKKTLEIRSTAAVENGYAAFLCQHGDPDRGVHYFKQAARAAGKDGGRADILANAGLCLYRAQRHSDAAPYFRHALKVDPKQFTALTHLARIEYHAGQYMNARAFIERADAAGKLSAGQLLLAARIEMALQDRQAARGYLKRHNQQEPTSTRSLSQLESSRQ